jgi:RNA polymerase sigma-70 factor (ECF subfamily)
MLFVDWYPRFRPLLAAALIVFAGETDVAIDAADEALARAFERWERIESLDSPEAWTYRVGANLVRRKMRRRSIERQILLRGEPLAPAPQLMPEVWMAVRSLPRRQREAIALRYILGMSEAEVASALDIAVGTASATLSAARSRLADVLGDEEQREVDMK